MHDFLLAKEITDAVIKLTDEKGLKNIKSVALEIGTGSVPHDHHHDDHVHDEHFDELNMDNVQFGLEAIAKNTILKDTHFNIKKIQGDSWRIVDIEVE